MANALKEINKRVKALKKKHPKSKRTTLQKQAGREWKAGKLKAKKIGTVKKRKPAHKKAVRRKVASRKKAVRTVTKIKRVFVTMKPKRRKKATRKTVKAKRRARVSGSGKSMLPMMVIGGLGLAAVYLLTRKPATTYTPTGNYQRDNAAGNILAYATAASLTFAAITKLIQALNSSSDAQVQAANQNPAGYVNQFVNAGD